MRVVWARLDRFRNLERQDLRLHPRYNLILGTNAQGKTNFLEGLGYLGTLHSIRSASRTDMIRKGEDFSLIEGEVETGASRHTLSVVLSSRGRAARVDDKPAASPEAFLNALKVVSFIPEDVGLVSGPPSQRRRAVDRSIFETGAPYIEEYRRYLYILRQRNALLRRRRFTSAEKESWDREYCSTGAVLVQRRCSLIERLNGHMDGLGRHLGIGPGLRLVYAASFVPTPGARAEGWSATTAREWAKTIAAHLERIAGREAAAGHSLAGPHRDDVRFLLGEEEGENADLARYGSQGQKRVAVLAFKLALANVVRETSGAWPVILLDDVASELDGSRRKALGALVQEIEAQFFITTTGDDYMFLPSGKGAIWRMEAGRLEGLSEGASGD